MITISCKTNQFNLSVVQKNFINDCCFGEDFSRWLVDKLNAVGIEANVICMEDFGWANSITHQNATYLMCIAGCSDDLPSDPNYGEWQITLEPHRTLLQRLLRQQNTTSDELLNKIKNVLQDASFVEVSINQ
ncbi:MAG: hypothetical protein VXW65_00400 [Pseudomonadota bacterium]|nr:hypothetical protein [Pseudomonadota bacterium]